MRDTTIWVLTANADTATIFANCGGVSVEIQSVKNLPLPGMSQMRSRCTFACTLMLELCRGAVDGGYDGLILVADQSMMDELKALMPSNVSRHVIGTVVEKLPSDVRETHAWNRENAWAA